MRGLTSVMFRGESRDVEIDHDGGYEHDTNAHVIEWHFIDAELADVELTDAEEQAIFDQLAKRSYEGDEDNYF